MEAEDELILRFRLVKWFRAIIKIEQTKYAMSEQMIPSDLLVIAPSKRPNYIPQACLIEVKDTKKFSYRITKRDLERRIEFAKACGLDLFFAVRLGGPEYKAWCLVPGNNLQKRIKKRVELEDYFSSWWDEFVGDFNLLVPGDIVILEHWSRTPKAPKLICKHKELGTL